jgi:hypothetical protein
MEFPLVNNASSLGELSLRTENNLTSMIYFGKRVINFLTLGDKVYLSLRPTLQGKGSHIEVYGGGEAELDKEKAESINKILD